MNRQRWDHIKRLFDEAAPLQGVARDDFLRVACGHDVELRAEVESLLAADADEDSVLDAPLSEALGGLFSHGAVEGRRFGPYKVLRELGRGGMAVVYEGQRDDAQFLKQVAIKLIKRGMDTDAIVARFRRERQILASLEHPNIARLLDGGVSDDGLPFLVMELVLGEPIDRYCDAHQLGVGARLRLFRTVCSAVHTAHQRLVVHRDLKPSNILVSDDGTPKLLDFGIAKLLDDVDDPMGADAKGPAQPTMAGLRPMTPEYASPEQMRGDAVTTASDVYSLGVLLYELLTGHRPLDLKSLTPRQKEDAVCDRLPARPSSSLTHHSTLLHQAELPDGMTGADWVGAKRGGSPYRLRRRLRGDLDNIVLKALHKDPTQRYRSAEQLSDDIWRHLRGLPVNAQRHTLWYRGRKFVRRNRWGVVAAGLILLSLTAGWISTARQADVARDERGRAEWVSQFMVDLFAISHPSRARGETITARQVLDRGADRIHRELGEAPQVRAEILRSIGLAYAKLGLFETAEPLLTEAVALRRGAAAGAPLALMAALNDLGELYTELARYGEAEALHREALRGRRQLLPDNATQVIESRNSLALALYHQKRSEEAEGLLRQALAQQGDDLTAAPFLNTTRNNLALVLKHLGRLDEAEAHYRSALHSNRRHLGEDHPEVATNLNNLAELLRAEGRCEQAIELYEEALVLEEKLLGDAHVDVAGLRNNLAGCFKDLSRWDDAEQLYLAALESRRNALGDEHPDVAATLNNLAEVYFKRRDLERSEALYREALDLHRRIHGNEHADVARTLGNLATTLADRGDSQGAEVLYRQALDMQRRLSGVQGTAVATQRHNLARLLLRMRRLEEAETQFRAAFERRRELLGPNHRDTAQSLFGMAVAAGMAGPPERAEGILRQGLETWRQRDENTTAQVAALQSLLGGALLALGELKEAETLLLASEAAKPDARTRQRLDELEALRQAERNDIVEQFP